MPPETKKRLSIDLDENIKEEFKSFLPAWGMQRPVVNALIKCVIVFFRRVGLGPALEALTRGRAKLVIEEKDSSLG